MTIDEKDVEPLALAERMDSHMGQADRGALLRDCHLAAAVIRRLPYESAKQTEGWRDISSVCPTLIKAGQKLTADRVSGKVVVGCYGDVPAVEFKRLSALLSAGGENG